MKKIIIVIMTLYAVIPNTIIFAEETTTLPSTPTRQNIIRDRLERQRQNYLQNLEEARDIAQEYRQTTDPVERAKLREKARLGFIVRLTNAVQKISDIQEKIESRIISAQENGLDVTIAQEQLELSREHLVIVLQEQDKLQELLTNQDIENTEIQKQAQTIFETIKENFKLSRKALIDSIQTLKKITIEENNETSTESKNEVKDYN